MTRQPFFIEIRAVFGGSGCGVITSEGRIDSEYMRCWLSAWLECLRCSFSLFGWTAGDGKFSGEIEEILELIVGTGASTGSALSMSGTVRRLGIAPPRRKEVGLVFQLLISV